ncbi:unnamed protein product [Echinostoma caproni]|uniref:Uncharacterized protein n=1 Tax=Echinostoma caproni TaxID=27848 RepID=A0A183AB05_9TREM|nr:unnamed protein product [Echinostoma caproni]
MKTGLGKREKERIANIFGEGIYNKGKITEFIQEDEVAMGAVFAGPTFRKVLSRRLTKSTILGVNTTVKPVLTKNECSLHPPEDEFSSEIVETSSILGDFDTDEFSPKFIVEPNPEAWRQKASSLIYSGLGQIIEQMVVNWEEVL